MQNAEDFPHDTHRLTLTVSSQARSPPLTHVMLFPRFNLLAGPVRPRTDGIQPPTSALRSPPSVHPAPNRRCHLPSQHPVNQIPPAREGFPGPTMADVMVAAISGLGAYRMDTSVGPHGVADMADLLDAAGSQRARLSLPPTLVIIFR